MSEFTGDRSARSEDGRRRKALGRQLVFGAAAVFIVVIAIAIMTSSGRSNFGFMFVLVFLLPMIMRVIRSFTGGSRRR